MSTNEPSYRQCDYFFKNRRIEDVDCYYLCKHFYDTFNNRRNDNDNFFVLYKNNETTEMPFFVMAANFFYFCRQLFFFFFNVTALYNLRRSKKF